MNLEGVDKKQLSQIEQLAKELLAVLTKAKLDDETIIQELKALADAATAERQARFDESDNGYKGF
jgi:hypothetical protein